MAQVATDRSACGHCFSRRFDSDLIRDASEKREFHASPKRRESGSGKLKYFILILRNLRRNLLRTTLTCVATMFLVFIVTAVVTILYTLNLILAEKSKDLKAIVTERWQIPSQMPFSYAASLSQGAARKPGDIVPDDHMTWQFYGGTIDPTKSIREGIVFFFAMEPDKIIPMMDEGETFDPEMIEKLKNKKNGAIIGKKRLAAMQRQVGDRITVTSMNYKNINLEFEIVGECPTGRYDQSAFMQRDYLNDALEKYKREQNKPHPLAEKTLGLVWLRVPDNAAFNRVSEQIISSPDYTVPAVKCETASSGIGPWLESYKDFLNLFQYVLIPVAFGTMILVVSNAISLSVRERRTEMAVLKVLGFQPGQVRLLVIGEALLLGGLSGLASAALTYYGFNSTFGGVPFMVAFFTVFPVPVHAFWWGLALGLGTALLGSVGPAWSASSVKPSEVFAKVA
jgi:putative ABC transport system permease protein